MKFPPTDDLFSDTTMTFGEHLEELRGALFRALLGLAIGVGIGLLLGQPVVHLIQTPLKAALEEFYAKRAEERVTTYLTKSGLKAEQLPFTADQAKEAIGAGLLPERVYVKRDRLRESPENPEPAKQPDAKASPEKTPAGAKILTPAEQEAEELGLVPFFIWRPSAETDRARSTAFGVQEAFMIYMKAALVTGIVVASPWIFYQLWMFVAAGLYPHEKHYVHVFLPFSLGLFLAGASLAFFFVFKPVLSFLFSFNDWLGIDPDPRISEWFSFVLILPLGFGISFQLPLVMLFLERIGIFTVEAYVEKWRIAIFAIVIISAVLTPADPYSLLLMAVPLTFLYFGGVLLCRYLPANREPALT